ncbi:hypothetical protein EKO27_g2260 [Xylaria grammica]|uniref:Ketosynthase family 3 (KS3) domain-containing protein n=1 Tax=Xylaria grammica TaxID=363999 RepID=A0A439DEK9_9PEZI|nr:hypothetical protein EKO27_g2260 [Xylaria grammica]
MGVFFHPRAGAKRLMMQRTDITVPMLSGWWCLNLYQMRYETEIRGRLDNASARRNSGAAVYYITHPTQPNSGRINYVEMHGTSTQAGDATEMSSVINVLARNSRTAVNPLYFGSVRPNLGHGEAGSGVTSLIKAVMMLRKSIIPPHIGIKSRINRKLPNMIEFHTHLSTGNLPFLPQPGRNRPGQILVNNFNAAGGHTSMVIQDPPQLLIEGVDPRPYHTVTICEKTLNSTQENAKRLLVYMKEHPEARLEDIAYTTTARRLHHQAYRQAYAVSSIDGLCRSLERAIAGDDSAIRIIYRTATHHRLLSSHLPAKDASTPPWLQSSSTLARRFATL